MISKSRDCLCLRSRLGQTTGLDWVLCVRSSGTRCCSYRHEINTGFRVHDASKSFVFSRLSCKMEGWFRATTYQGAAPMVPFSSQYSNYFYLGEHKRCMVDEMYPNQLEFQHFSHCDNENTQLRPLTVIIDFSPILRCQSKRKHWPGAYTMHSMKYAGR